MTNTEAAAPASASGFFDTEWIWMLASSSIDMSAISAGKASTARAGSASSNVGKIDAIGSTADRRRIANFIGFPGKQDWLLNTIWSLTEFYIADTLA